MIEVGDKVYTVKGCRIKGCYGAMTVTETGRKWSGYEAVMCKKRDGSKRLFLVKNLRQWDNKVAK